MQFKHPRIIQSKTYINCTNYMLTFSRLPYSDQVNANSRSYPCKERCRLVHPKIEMIYSPFQMGMSFCLLMNKKEDILKNVSNPTNARRRWFHWNKNTMEFYGYPQLFGYTRSLEYLLPWSTEERNPYRFGTTWQWANNDTFLIFRGTIHGKSPHVWMLTWEHLLLAPSLLC